MGKQTTLNRVVFQTVRWIVSDSDLHADLIAQLLQIVLEDVLACGIAATTVVRQQDRRGVGITLLADSIPKPFETVARELGGIVKQPEIDMPKVEFAVIDAMRNHHSVSPRIDRIMPNRRPQCLHAT